MPSVEIHPDFAAHPWCLDIVNSSFNKAIAWPSRPANNPADNPCSLFGNTLNTVTGIRAAHSLWHSYPEEEPSGQALLLVSMGDGMNYYSGTLHGGMVAALLDGTSYLLIARTIFVIHRFQDKGLALRNIIRGNGIIDPT